MLEYTLYGDPLIIITKFMKLVDIYNLSLNCKKLYIKLTPSIKTLYKKNIVDRLKLALGQHYNSIMFILYNSNVKLYGSFLLQCLLEESYDGSDIDIFTNDTKCIDTLIMYAMYHNLYTRAGGEYINSATNIYINNIIVQIISGAENKGYDIDICNGIITFDINYTPIINRLKYVNIFNRQCTINNSEYRMNTIKRVIKYNNRKFDIISKIDNLLYVEYHIIMNNILDIHKLYICGINYDDYNFNTNFVMHKYNKYYFRIINCYDCCSIKFYLDIPHIHCYYKNYIQEEIIFINTNKYNYIVDNLYIYTIYPNSNKINFIKTGKREINDYHVMSISDMVSDKLEKYDSFNNILYTHFKYLHKFVSIDKYLEHKEKCSIHKNNNYCNIIK
jgi:hypothetical protein